MKVNKTFEEPDGHVTKVLGLASDAESLERDVIEVLEQVWIGGIFYDEDIDQYSDALKEFDVDLKEELRSRGMEDPFADKRDRLIKDRGDIGEVLGYLVETKVRGIAPDDPVRSAHLGEAQRGTDHSWNRWNRLHLGV